MGIDRAQTQKEHYIQTQEKRIDLYFKYNLKDYHSMHVTNFEKNFMAGSYFVSGYINNNKNMILMLLYILAKAINLMEI